MRILLSLLRLLFPERASERLVRETTSLTLQERDIGTTHVLLSYRDPAVRAAVIEAKYHRNEQAILLLSKALRAYLKDTEVIIIPVPLSAKRLEERGYNQVEEVARAAGARVENALTRHRDTVPQTTLSGERRRENMRNAFVATPYPPASYLLLDDVTTTGATLEAAAEALRAAGTTDFSVLALAH